MHGQKNIKLCNAEQAKRVYQYNQLVLLRMISVLLETC